MPIKLRHSCPFHYPNQTHDVFFLERNLPQDGRRIAYKCPDSGKEVVIPATIPVIRVSMVPHKSLVGYLR